MNSDMQQYRCPRCDAGGAHPKASPAPLCLKCDAAMSPSHNGVIFESKSLEAGGKDLAGTIIHAHLAGQADAGIDPSYSNAQAYYRECQGVAKPKPMMEIAAGENFHTRVEGIDVLLRNLSHSDYRVHLEVEKIPLVFSMDEEWLYKWATCFGIRLYKDGDQFSKMWMQFETTPIWEDGCGDHDYGYLVCIGRSAPIMYHAPKLPDNDVRLQDTLTFVTEDYNEDA